MLAFIRRYWLCVVMGAILVIGVAISTACADWFVSGTEHDMIRFDLKELYLVYILPLCSIVYGCVSYVKTKSIWMPQLVVCVIAFLYWFRLDVDALFLWETYILSIYPVFCSLIGTLATAHIRYVVKASKDNQNKS